MLHVYEVARRVFWNDEMFDSKLLPSEASLAKSSYTLSDLAVMSGAERLTVFKECNIDPSLHPLFLRSLQHVTAIYGPGSISDSYVLHRHHSAYEWAPSALDVPILGYPNVMSSPYRVKYDPSMQGCASVADQPHPSADNPVSHIGLLNQGATCYLNSLLQTLYHISEFRSIIYGMPTQEEAAALAQADVPEAKSIPYALQRLFCKLQTTSHALGTRELTESFGWSASESFIQHDVHELTRVLLDNLEKKLNVQMPDAASPKENAINKLFHGSLESYVRVDEANYYGAREEPFYDLQLVVKNTKDIYASFDSFFQVEVLDGRNKYCLEQKGEKTYHRAEKGVRFKKLPPILLLHLTRFDYDIHKGETKVLTRWDYYSTLNLSRYLPEAPADVTHYTLFSVLVHSGSNTGFGHYFCFVQCAGAWYKFNDETVTTASLKDVFGANFGGFRYNYWGAEVPHTANAYMLVYIRTSLIDSLLRPISDEEIPVHVIEQLMAEKIEEDRNMREKAVDYLYGRIHFIQPQEVVDECKFLTYRKPEQFKYSSHRTLRVLLEVDALTSFATFVEKQMGVARQDQTLWYACTRPGGDRVRLCAQVKPGVTVRDILGGTSEMCVLVMSSTNSAIIRVADDAPCEKQIFHHKLYDPLQLKEFVLGSTVVERNPDGNSEDVLKLMDPVVRDMIGMLPDESRKLVGHHLDSEKGGGGGGATRVENSPRAMRKNLSVQSIDLHGNALALRGVPREALSVLRENEYHTFSPCDSLTSGDILVWQLEAHPDMQKNIFYPNIESFQHFLRNQTHVIIKLNKAPHYPVLIDTCLAEDMTYEQLQRYVAYLIGDVPNFDRIRFTRHNPETELPYFMKGKRKDRPTLLKLLTPATNRMATLSKFLYYEYCKYTVTEIESAHSLQFKLYSDHVKCLSSHWVLMPREVPIAARELFITCIREVRKDYESQKGNPIDDLFVDSADQPDDTPSVSQLFTADTFVEYLQSADPEEAWRQLRLVDVWRGRIYNVLDVDHPLVFEGQSFEESAEYRIEKVPLPVPGVPASEQVLLQFHHFSLSRQRKEPTVETHGDPFSLYVNHNELPADLLKRVAEKLDVSAASIIDWKICLVKDNRVVHVAPESPMGDQIRDFCDPEGFLPNPKDPAKVAFVGLEHAPTAKRAAKREDMVVILN